MGVGGQRHSTNVFNPGKDPVPIVQEAGWAPWPVWMGAENLAPTGIRSPDRQARSEWLSRTVGSRDPTKILREIGFPNSVFNPTGVFLDG